jgi:hypothetical protein
VIFWAIAYFNESVGFYDAKSTCKKLIFGHNITLLYPIKKVYD